MTHIKDLLNTTLTIRKPSWGHVEHTAYGLWSELRFRKGTCTYTYGYKGYLQKSINLDENKIAELLRPEFIEELHQVYKKWKNHHEALRP